MKRNVLRKLKSNEGASLTFAILLFLVCAVIGSIILTAGTIASGRLADKAKMDQRYYHVVSAAEFFKDALDKKEVVIIRKKTGSLSVEGYDDVNPNYDFLTARTLELLDSNDYDADFFSTSEKNSTFFFQITDPSAFEVAIDATVRNGKMFIDIHDDDYKVRMTFEPNVTEIVSEIESVETKISTVTWHVTNIEKVFGN